MKWLFLCTLLLLGSPITAAGNNDCALVDQTAQSLFFIGADSNDGKSKEKDTDTDSTAARAIPAEHVVTARSIRPLSRDDKTFPPPSPYSIRAPPQV